MSRLTELLSQVAKTEAALAEDLRREILSPDVRVSVRDAESAAAVYRDAGIAYE